MAQKPILGWGIGSFESVFAQADTCGSIVKQAHNEYLQVGVELGLIGCVLLLMAMWSLARVFLQGLIVYVQARQDSLFIWVAVSLSGTLVQSLFTFPFQLPYITIVLAVLLAAVVPFGVSDSGVQKKPLKPLYVPFAFKTVLMALALSCLVNSFFWARELHLINRSLQLQPISDEEFLAGWAPITPPWIAGLGVKAYDHYGGSREQYAEHVLRKSLEQTPESASLYYNLSRYSHDSNDHQSSLAYGYEVYKIGLSAGAWVQNTVSFFNLYDERYDYESARILFEEYLDSIQEKWAANNRQFWFVSDLIHLAGLCLEYQKAVCASRYIERVVQIAPEYLESSTQLQLLLARKYVQEGDLGSAVAWYARALETNRNPMFRAHILKLIAEVQGGVSE